MMKSTFGRSVTAEDATAPSTGEVRCDRQRRRGCGHERSDEDVERVREDFGERVLRLVGERRWIVGTDVTEDVDHVRRGDELRDTGRERRCERTHPRTDWPARDARRVEVLRPARDQRGDRDARYQRGTVDLVELL